MTLPYGLIEREHIRRPHWAQGVYVYTVGKTAWGRIWMHTDVPGCADEPWNPSVDDLLATDWEDA